ncbi:putative membrane protein YkoI [Anoxybacillus tepidamans]|uniref:Putative membrane protein YkoI n=1 Tax=Anoxybacteroides tepidamans TaxID=265948 RepID=A0A7W8IP80_9BACL|nr:PepSY domain-containing protein [Anoxybacillus tepidamans]MBB5323332.1 putative membrane protein YkoI [Anoxybacillus tepidamans]
MNKKFLIPALALSIVGGGMIGAALKHDAFAASQTAPASNKEVSEQQEKDQLQATAKITEKQAIAIALQHVKGQENGTELENEDGVVVYAVEVKGEQGKLYDVKVDAQTGAVVNIDQNDQDKNEGEYSDKETNDDQNGGEADSVKITKEEATNIALHEVSGEIKEVDVEKENNEAVYSVTIQTKQGKQEVKIDAETGKVLKVEADDQN